MTEFARQQGVSEADEWAWRRKLAVMCRIVGIQGSIGLFGHISIRIPGTDVVLMTPGAGVEKSTTRTEQVFVFGLDGKIHYHPGGDRPAQIPAEWRIHTQIHKDRPEIGSVAHLHAHASTLLGIARKPIVPVFAQGALFKDGVPVWGNPRLVVNDELAIALSKALGDKRACQMRGHGSVVVGATAEACLVACTFIEENAQYQIEAAALGGVTPMSAEEVADCSRGSVGGGLERMLWDFWARRVDVEGLPL
jgi:ribulose-5-phosphate 4-epimerase/fuculose-1-phosphate aldolase